MASKVKSENNYFTANFSGSPFLGLLLLQRQILGEELEIERHLSAEDAKSAGSSNAKLFYVSGPETQKVFALVDLKPKKFLRQKFLRQKILRS